MYFMILYVFLLHFSTATYYQDIASLWTYSNLQVMQHVHTACIILCFFPHLRTQWPSSANLGKCSLLTCWNTLNPIQHLQSGDLTQLKVILKNHHNHWITKQRSMDIMNSPKTASDGRRQILQGGMAFFKAGELFAGIQPGGQAKARASG